MARLDLRTFIAAPPRVVWDVICHFDRQREWMVDLRTLDIASERRQGEGVVLHVTSELFGLPVVKDVMTVIAWQPPQRMDVAHSGLFHGTGSFVLDPVDNGTIFSWIEEFEAPMGRLGELGFALLIGPHLRGVFRRSMANVKRLAEERAAFNGGA